MAHLTDYTTPPSVQQFNDTVTAVGGTLGALAVIGGTIAAVRRWWHRKRNRQEAILVAHLTSLKADLVDYIDEKHNALNTRVDATSTSVENLKTHIDAVVEPLVDRQLRIESDLSRHLQKHIA